MKPFCVFLQVSHRVTASVNPVLEYYTEVYERLPGFEVASPDFMELPTWIATANGMIGDNYEKVLHVVTDVEETVKYLNSLPWDATILASVMDVNVEVIRHIMEVADPHYWVVGGYIDFKAYPWKGSVITLGDIKSLYHVLKDVNVDASPDYSIFGAMRTIPRLSLSDGCLHNCAFCTIEREVVECDDDDIWRQVYSFATMNFSLVYISDKTFGQAKNTKLLKVIAQRIREYNPEFEGFIVQTTVNEAYENMMEWSHAGVKYIEVGVEHVDADYLQRMRKPYNLKHLDRMTSFLRYCNKMARMGSGDEEIGFIPNIMFGLPDASYADTIEWVIANKDIISFVNPFILCQYSTSKGSLVDDASGAHDQDENSLDKSWLSEVEVWMNKQAMACVFAHTRGE